MNWTFAIFAVTTVTTIGVVSSGAKADSPKSSKPAIKVPAKPTYATDVAKIINDRCVECHRPGEVGPFSLVKFEDAKKWSQMIAATTGSRRMPPWKAKEGYGSFKHENRLSETEIATLKVWADQGAPRGAKEKEPKPPTFSGGEWTLGKPDTIIEPERAYNLAPEGEDVYRNFVIPTNFAEPRFVRAIDVKPGNSKVVHHVIMFLDERGASDKLVAGTTDGQPGYIGQGGGVGFIPSGSLGGWAPGIRATYLNEGTAYRINPGTRLVMQVHYHKSGKPETDKTRVALYFAKEAPEREMKLNWLFNFAVNIPAGEKAYKMRKEYVYREDVTIHQTMPHMHLLGRDMKSWFELPDGTVKPLVHVDDWDFNWQLNYSLKEPLKLPKGTKQIVEATYDNSSDNPHNPNNPPKRVTWGEETNDEMFLMVTAYTFDSPSAAANSRRSRLQSLLQRVRR